MTGRVVTINGRRCLARHAHVAGKTPAAQVETDVGTSGVDAGSAKGEKRLVDMTVGAGRPARSRPFPLGDLLNALHAQTDLPWHPPGRRTACTNCALGACFNNRVIADLLGINLRQLYRLRASGLTDIQADELTTRAGLHPVEVWGAQWWAPTSDLAACLIVGDGDHHVIIEATDTAASVAVYGPSSAHGSTCAEVYATTDDDDTDAGLAVFVEGDAVASVRATEDGGTVWTEEATR